jgi:hypothetical protein
MSFVTISKEEEFEPGVYTLLFPSGETTARQVDTYQYSGNTTGEMAHITELIHGLFITIYLREHGIKIWKDTK